MTKGNSTSRGGKPGRRWWGWKTCKQCGGGSAGEYCTKCVGAVAAISPALDAGVPGEVIATPTATIEQAEMWAQGRLFD